MVAVLLRGGHVVDGTGAEPFPADVLVDRGVIVDVAEGLRAEADVIDVDGRYVLPGFVDAHSHAEGHLDAPDVAMAHLRQGVTTVVTGQDGVSFAPAGASVAGNLDHYFAGINGPRPRHLPAGCSVAQLLDGWEGRSYLNVAQLVPAGNLRAAVVGFADRPATAGERRRMCALLAEGLNQGAVGMSTGLEYVPGGFASTGELTELCGVLAAHDTVHVSHMRGYGGSADAGLDELVSLAAQTSVSTHVSHLHGPLNLIVERLTAATEAGFDISFDSYPYRRGNTLLAMLALPPGLQAGGPARTVAALRDPTVRAGLDEEGWFASVADLLSRVTISSVADVGWRWAEGKSLAAIGDRLQVPVGEAVCRLLAESDLVVGCVVRQPETNDLEAIRVLLRQPGHMAGSDGIFVGGHPHPRARGTFARFIARHTVMLGDWSWGEAARHLSSRAVDRFGLGRRGRVLAGHVADLVVLDAGSVADRATYDDPLETATGIDHVLIGGRMALRDGRLVERPSGRAVRREGTT